MIYFCASPYHNLVTILLTCLFINYHLMGAAPVMAAVGRDIEVNDFVFELSTEDEIVQMAGYGQEKLSTVLITGVVLCKSCIASPGANGHPHGHQYVQQPLSGATIAATCHNNINNLKPTSVRTVTDEYGEFIIDLPSHLHAIPHLEKECAVKVIHLSKDSPCQPSPTSLGRKHRSIELSSVGNGIRTYSAGSIILHLKDSTGACKKDHKALEAGDTLMSW